jgi:molecular chaperone GrpE
VTDPTGSQGHFPDAGQVDFDAESTPDEAHVESPDETGPRETAAPPVGPEGPFDQEQAAGGEGSELESRIAELTSDLQRLQAEYLNYKRRVDRDREVVVSNAKLTVLSALLPVLDDVDRAREHEELSGGFKAVAEALERVVVGAGLEKFGAKGDEFDPRLHEALMHGHSSEVTTTVCDNVFQAGYRLGDRVVRAAKVTVLDPEPG